MPMPRGFRWKGNGSKIECTTCLRTGYFGGAWMRPCLGGHPFSCVVCGMDLSTKGSLAQHAMRSHPTTPLTAHNIETIQRQLQPVGGAYEYLSNLFSPTNGDTL